MILLVWHLKMSLEAILDPKSRNRKLKVVSSKVLRVETIALMIEIRVMEWRVDLRVNLKKIVKTLERLQSFLLNTR
jgi:hypothetical protein